MQDSSFFAQSETSELSHLQNEFILSQERTLLELRLRNEHLQRQLQEFQRSQNSHLAVEAQLQFELKSLHDQLQFERDQCTSRQLSAGKYKEKFSEAQTVIQQLEKVNTAIQRQLYEYRSKYETVCVRNEELVKGASTRAHDIMTANDLLVEENRKLKQRLEQEHESKLNLQEKVQELTEMLHLAQSKLAESESRSRALRISNSDSYDEMQLNLEKILRKVDMLEEQNEQLRRHQHKLELDANRYRDEAEDISRRYNFIAKKKAHESARQLQDKLSPRKKLPS